MRSARSTGRLTIYLGAFGQPGHAFPMLALGARLVARGHRVAYETWSRWREPVEAAGMEFVAAPEYPVFPTRERPLKPYEAVVLAAAESRRAIVGRAPDVVVQDILTLAPAMAAELEGIPFATLIPHVSPVGAPGFPPYSFGARIPRTRLGASLWRTLDRPVERGLRRGRTELNETRSRLGLPPVERLHGGLSPHLCLFGTLPQLEYPRAWPPEAHIVGPLMWEPPFAEVELPAGDEPLVLIAPSTAQDPEQRLLTCALEGLAGEPIRVLATTNRKPLPRPVAPPANARLVEWLSYSRTIPRAALVVCHAGHGTVVRALACGTPLLAVPHSGDMAENAARIDWAGVGLRLPWRMLSPATLRLAVRRALGQERFALQARTLARWAHDHDGPTRAAELVEELAFSRGATRARTR
ncbi:MAG: glycosyl transferase [Actinomycetota bacterium]|nr:glycosyl transferase [Actinomycetota bacterium]